MNGKTLNYFLPWTFQALLGGQWGLLLRLLHVLMHKIKHNVAEGAGYIKSLFSVRVEKIPG